MVFDYKNTKYHIMNTHNDIESILSNSPVTCNGEFVGCTYNVSRMGNKDMYYGTVLINNFKYKDCNNLKIVNQKIVYDEKTLHNNFIYITSVISEVELS